jgi:zinc protease
VPSAHKDEGVTLLQAALNAPLFADDAVKRMIHALEGSARFNQQDPGWIASQTLFSKAFPLHPYGRPPEGTEKTIAALSADDVRAHAPKILCRDTLKIALTGDLDRAAAVALVDRVFGDWPACPVLQTPHTHITTRGQTVHVPRDGAQSVVLMAQMGAARADPDWWAMRLLDYALGGGDFSSRLMHDLRVKRGLTYGVSSALAPYDYAPLWMVQTATPPDKAAAAVARVHAIWADVAKNGLSDDEIAAAKAYLIGSLPLALTTGSDIAAVMLQMQEDHLSLDTLDRRAQDIQNVTAADMRRVAADRLKPKDFFTVIVGPKGHKK